MSSTAAQLRLFLGLFGLDWLSTYSWYKAFRVASRGSRDREELTVLCPLPVATHTLYKLLGEEKGKFQKKSSWSSKEREGDPITFANWEIGNLQALATSLTA